MITEEEFVAGINILMRVEILMMCLKDVWRTTTSWPLFTERVTRITVTSSNEFLNLTLAMMSSSVFLDKINLSWFGGEE